MDIQKRFSGILCAAFGLVYSILLFCLSISQLNVEGLIDLYKAIYISDLIFSVIIFIVSIIGVVYFTADSLFINPLFLFVLLFCFITYKIIQIIIYFSNHGEGNFGVIFSLILLILLFIALIVRFVCFKQTEEASAIDSVLAISCGISNVILYLKLNNNVCDLILLLICLTFIFSSFIIFRLHDNSNLSNGHHYEKRNVSINKTTNQTSAISKSKPTNSEELNAKNYFDKQSFFKEENKPLSLENNEGFMKINYRYKIGYKVDFIPKGTKIKILNRDSKGNCEISFIDSSNKEVVLKNVSNLYFETKN